MARGGYRPGAGRKPNPFDKPKAVATTKVRPQTMPAQARAPQPGGPGLDPKYVAGLVETLAAAGYKLRDGGKNETKSPFRLPQVPPGVTPPNSSRIENAYGIKDAPTMAMDEEASSWASGQWGNYSGLAGFLAAEGAAFPGYTALAELAQLPEYRIISETIADDATREWIEYDVAGDETDERDKAERKNNDPVGEIERERDPDEQAKRLRQAGLTDKVKALTEDQERLEARDRFYSAVRDDGFFGRAHMFLGFGEDGTVDLANAAAELRQDIGDGRNAMSRGKVDKSNPLRELKVIEPVWTYPQAYNAINPLLPFWYDPQQWYVMGVEVHQSRLLKFIGHPVPDLLKPAYSFGGISLTQMATPYVNIWLQTRESVAALIKAFSVMVLSTDMQTQTAPGAAAGGIIARAQLFNMLRDNMGLMITNEKTETFSNVSTPLGSLDALQAQAQEHLTFPSRIPIVKMTGNQPTGLNASTDGEIRMYYDTITSFQHRVIRPNLTRVVNFEQCGLFGDVDPKLKFKFKSLYQMTPKEQADLEKAEAERDEKFIAMGALAPEEVRTRIIKDDRLPYTDLDPNDVPDLEQEEESGLEPEGGRPQPQAGGGEKKPGQGGEAGDEAVVPFAGAADEAKFEEGKHPRGPDGKFASGGGGSFASKKEHVAHLLKQGTTTKEILAATGWPSVSVPQQAAAAGLKLEKYTEGGVTKYKGTPMTDAEKAEFKKAVAGAKIAKQSSPAVPMPPPPASFPDPTKEELEKAKKTAALQVQYVPGANMLSGPAAVEAQKLVDKFNEKWANKSPIPIGEKVYDFKQLTAQMAPLAAMAAEQQKALAAKQAAEAQAKAKAQAEAAAAAAKAAAEKNKAVMAGLGITAQEAEGFNALVEMLGGSQKDVVEQFKQYEKEAEGKGFPISGFECAVVKNYSNGGYHAVNAALRKGTWTPAQHVYAKMIDKAIDKMPKFAGKLQRGASLTAEQQALYVDGNIVEERAMTSCGDGFKFSGNTTFHVEAIGKRGSSIKSLSHYKSEQEVLFRARTFFKVSKVEGKPGGPMVVHMVEMEE